MTTVKELGLEPSLKEDEPMCSICCGELTVNNIVNPECGHATCKECFWRWAKDKNSCPFCRKSLLKNDEEAQDIQQMRQLLEHRTRIIRQVEDAYDEEENLKQKANRLRRRLGNMEEAYEGSKSLVKKEKEKLEELKKANGGAYQTLKHLQEQQKALDEFNRKNRDKIDLASANLAHGDKGMCIEVLKDIKILGRSASNMRARWALPFHLDKVSEMNRVRKERMEQRRIRDSANRCYSCCSLGLRELFGEDEHEVGSDFENIFEIFQHMADVSGNVVIAPNNYIQTAGRREMEHMAQHYYNSPPRSQTININHPPPLRRRRRLQEEYSGQDIRISYGVGEYARRRLGGIPPGFSTDDDILELE